MALRDTLPKGSSRNKIEALADIVDSIPKGNFKPVSMVLEPKRFDTYRGMRKDFFRLVDNYPFENGPYEFTENNGISIYQFTRNYEVSPPSWDELPNLPPAHFPIDKDLVAFQVNVTFELLIKDLPDEYSDVEKLKGLKLQIYLNRAEDHDEQATDIAYIPATLIKKKYGGVMISGSAHSAFTLEKPLKGSDIYKQLYLGCVLSWDETDFDFGSYSKSLMWKENAFELTSASSQLGVRVSILDVHSEAPKTYRPSNPE